MTLNPVQPHPKLQSFRPNCFVFDYIMFYHGGTVSPTFCALFPPGTTCSRWNFARHRRHSTAGGGRNGAQSCFGQPSQDAGMWNEIWKKRQHCEFISKGKQMASKNDCWNYQFALSPSCFHAYLTFLIILTLIVFLPEQTRDPWWRSWPCEPHPWSLPGWPWTRPSRRRKEKRLRRAYEIRPRRHTRSEKEKKMFNPLHISQVMWSLIMWDQSNRTQNESLWNNKCRERNHSPVRYCSLWVRQKTHVRDVVVQNVILNHASFIWSKHGTLIVSVQVNLVILLSAYGRVEFDNDCSWFRMEWSVSQKSIICV